MSQERPRWLPGVLLKEGLAIYYEGAGPLGIPGAGTVSPIPDDRLFGYQRIHGWQKLFWARSYVSEAEVKTNFYYMSCANKIPCALAIEPNDIRPISPKCPEQLGRWVVKANRDYAKVYPYMQYRHLLPSADDSDREIGVEWTSDKGKRVALFSYGEFPYPVPAGAKVLDVTEDRAVTPDDNHLQTKPWHTYLISL